MFEPDDVLIWHLSSIKMKKGLAPPIADNSLLIKKAMKHRSSLQPAYIGRLFEIILKCLTVVSPLLLVQCFNTLKKF